MRRHAEQLWLLILLTAGMPYAAPGAPDPAADPAPWTVLRARALPDKLPSGAPLAVEIYGKGRPPYLFGGTRLFVYRKNAPERFFADSKLAMQKNAKDARYDSIEIGCWQWFKHVPEATVVRRVDTTGWPPGTYRMVAHVLFYPGPGPRDYRFSGTELELEITVQKKPMEIEQ